ncbi:NAD(P)-dependent oxidoreductase [Paraburkholderia phosphatilytica]|uniref:NAD(P)-dependent oxidoreductase n=1 Tax=Paraburkholderia phosphatilytica TaxID=2282883 RepID=UPI000E4C2DE6|nr:NAD(P)-dependent oxidoreductase [Paraburkholderia phosphatilytica]
MDNIKTVALIGFGEAGGILGAELARKDVAVSMWDIKLDGPEGAAMRLKAEDAGVIARANLEACVGAGQLVISAVTASSDAEVVEAAARFIRPGQVFMDINSVSPATKQHGRQVIEAAGAAFVEAAVMAPVPPYGLRVPMLLGGREAAQLAPALQALGFDATAIATEVGVASAVKMCRSVMIKGIEALSVECLSAARAYGAEELVLASLKETFAKLQRDADPAGYLISRVAEHGRRRAAEMREVSDTLREAGIAPLMSDATARLQDATVDAMAAHGIAYDATVPFDWRKLVDTLKK